MTHTLNAYCVLWYAVCVSVWLAVVLASAGDGGDEAAVVALPAATYARRCRAGGAVCFESRRDTTS